MKKLIIGLCLLLTCSLAHAEPIDVPELLGKIPSMKQGFAYSFEQEDFNYLTTATLFKWKDFNLEGGYSTSDKLVGVMSTSLIDLSKYVEVPILKDFDLNVGIYAGYGGIDPANTESKFDWGVSFTAFEVKF